MSLWPRARVGILRQPNKPKVILPKPPAGPAGLVVGGRAAAGGQYTVLTPGFPGHRPAGNKPRRIEPAGEGGLQLLPQVRPPPPRPALSSLPRRLHRGPQR